MKTTSLFTITGVIAFAILGITRFNGEATNQEQVYTNGKMELARLAKGHDNFNPAVMEKPSQEVVAVSYGQAETSTDAQSCELNVDGSEICLDSIVFIEAEETVDLGFDVNEYLPAGFDPYARVSADLDLNTVQFVEEDDFEDLGFDTDRYLPIGFNPYAGMAPDLDSIEFIADEEPIDLGFDTNIYLPKGFNPYAMPELDLDDIIFIEEEESVNLGFDVEEYLPAGFDPYAPAEFDLDAIIFIEEDEIDIWEGIEYPANNAAFNY